MLSFGDIAFRAASYAQVNAWEFHDKWGPKEKATITAAMQACGVAHTQDADFNAWQFYRRSDGFVATRNTWSLRGRLFGGTVEQLASEIRRYYGKE